MESRTLSITERRLEAIRRHSLYQTSMHRLLELEQSRIFCRHGMEHLLDVARIAYIENLENHIGIDKELIYAAALLHDIGRGLQYTQGIPHDQAGAKLAEEILRDCGFDGEEQREILDAISSHRDIQSRDCRKLAGVLYRADKRSRMCGFCKASGECNWSEEKKNHQLYV